MQRLLRHPVFVAFAVVALAALNVIWSRQAEGRPFTMPDLRPPAWAQPLYLPGCRNLHKIAPGLYRGAQPTPEGFRQLKALGIKTIVNLRHLHSDKDEMKKAGATDFEYIEIEIDAWDVDFNTAARFLRVVTNPAHRPLFFHCQHGADRTGSMAAVYRMAVEGWSAEAALTEMREGGFNYHSIWKNLPPFLKGLDVEALRKAAGLSPAQQTPQAE